MPLSNTIKNRRPPMARRRRAGKVAILVAIMLPTVLIPLLAIGVDGGILSNDRRRLQSAVDAAALSAAVKLYHDNPLHSQPSVQPDVVNGARIAALDALEEHGFSDANCQARTVTMPANSSNPRVNGKPGTIEVIVTYLQRRGFSGIWGSSDLQVTARAVARARNFSQGNGLILLEESDDRSLYGRGGGTLIVNEGGAVVNSSGWSAAQTDGDDTVLAATSFNVTGDYTGDGYYETPYPESGSADPYTGSVPVPDPLRDLPEPSPSDYSIQSAPPNSGPAGTVITLSPGRYTTRLYYDGPRTIELLPGVYYLDQGIGLQGEVQLMGAEVMIYNAGSGSNNINLGGKGQWTLTPPTTGTYAGISIFQSRGSSEETTSVLRGNGGAGVTGTIYAPTTKVLLTGNGTQTLGSQFIARTLELAGEGHFTVDFAGPKAPPQAVIELVE